MPHSCGFSCQFYIWGIAMANTNPLERLKAMIHYIADAVPRQALGKTKLNKILWFSDREMYLRTGHTISGDAYLRFPQGPVSKNILQAQDELACEGKILYRRVKRPYEQYEYISLMAPDISFFSAEEIDVIGRQIAWIAPLSAKEVSAISHDRTWQTYKDGEEIPMFAVLAATTRDFQPEDLNWALEET